MKKRPSQTSNKTLPAVWKSGVIGAVILTALYIVGVYIFSFESAFLTVDLAVFFTVTWLACTFIVWIWRTGDTVLAVETVIGIVLVVLVLLLR